MLAKITHFNQRMSDLYSNSINTDVSMLTQAGTRWDTNLTGFRGEEEMGFDARPAVYAGYFQAITDIVP